MPAILKAPWQVGLAIAATFVAAADYLGQALTHLFLLDESDSLEKERQAGLVHMTHNNSYDSVLGLEQFDDLTSRVFILVGVALLVLGAFLWAGAFRGGVRGILTVTLAVSFLGGLYPLVLAFDPANNLDTGGLVEAQLVNVLSLVFVLLLWGKAGQKWVTLGAKKKWDQD